MNKSGFVRTLHSARLSAEIVSARDALFDKKRRFSVHADDRAR
jgi:hypothetical protein